MLITFKQLMGASVDISIAPSATMRELLQQAADKLGFAKPSHMNLIAHGKAMKPDKIAPELVRQVLKEGSTVCVLPNFRGVGGMNFEGTTTDSRVGAKRKEMTQAMNPLVGRKIHAVQRTAADDRQEGVALQISDDPEDVLYAGGGPDHFKLGAGGGLRVKGAAGVDALVGKVIEKLEYREWRTVRHEANPATLLHTW